MENVNTQIKAISAEATAKINALVEHLLPNFFYDQKDWIVWRPDIGLWVLTNTHDVAQMIAKETVKMFGSTSETSFLEYPEPSPKYLDALLRGTDVFSNFREVLEFMKAFTPTFAKGCDPLKAKLNSKSDHLPIAGNLIVDLKTGIVRPRVQEDWCSIEAGVKSIGDPQNEAVLRLVQGWWPDPDVSAYAQLLLGFLITGEAPANKFWAFQGPPNSGKSSMMKVMLSILGGLCICLPRDELISQRPGSPEDHLASLGSARLVLVNEVESVNRKIMERLTAETVTYRVMYDFTFRHTKVIGKICIGTYDDSIKLQNSGCVMCPIGDSLREPMTPEPALVEKICTSGLGDFFAWVLEGAKLYYHNPALLD